VQSQFFSVQIEIELGPDWQQSESALLQRQGAGQNAGQNVPLRVLWRYG
jgi:hypothetical protein